MGRAMTKIDPLCGCQFLRYKKLKQSDLDASYWSFLARGLHRSLIRQPR